AVRSKDAAKALEAALKIDPTLREAQWRLAQLRAPGDAQAQGDPEAIVIESAGSPFAYLSAMSLGATAQSNGDSDEAVRWYEHALSLLPGSTAAAVGLATLRPSSPVPFQTRADDDLYYSYPCIVLTSEVNIALAERVQRRRQP